MGQVNVEVLGAGTVGKELESILSGHPNIENVELIKRGEQLSEAAEVSFLALPHGESAKYAEKVLELGKKVIDLSGDLRFKTAAEYEKWYGQPHPAPSLLPVVYGLSEKNRKHITGQNIVAVPGCYPTAVELGIMPLIDTKLIKQNEPIIVSAISGYSGRGKQQGKASAPDITPYKHGRAHRHVGEIEQFTDGRNVLFFPEVAEDIERGILARTHLRLRKRVESSLVRMALEEAYQDEPFVKVLDSEEGMPTHQLAVNSEPDSCVINFSENKGVVTVYSNIDNLRKGAASQAAQCFNLMQGFEETAGLLPKSESS